MISIYVFLMVWGLGFGGIPVLLLLLGEGGDNVSILCVATMIGVCAFGYGLIGIMKHLMISIFGKTRSGVILDFVESNLVVNGVPQMVAICACVVHEDIKTFKVGLKDKEHKKLRPGQFITMKTRKDKAILFEILTNENSVEFGIRNILGEYFSLHGNNLRHKQDEEFFQEKHLSEADWDFLGIEKKSGNKHCKVCGAKISTDVCEFCGARN